MLTLKQCQADEATGHIVATYTVKSASADAPAISVSLTIHSDGANARIEMEPFASDSEEAALDGLADALERAAASIRARGEAKLGVPVYG